MTYERGRLLRLLVGLADLEAHLGDDGLPLRDHSAEGVDLVGHRCDSRLVVARVALDQHELHRASCNGNKNGNIFLKCAGTCLIPCITLLVCSYSTSIYLKSNLTVNAFEYSTCTSKMKMNK